MSQKALFFDVDGTLVNDTTKKIPPSAVEAIREVRAQNNLVFINSGRVAALMKNTDKIIETDGLIFGCGTQIIMGGKTIMEHRIPHKRGVEIKKSLVKYNIEGILEAQEAIYFPSEPFKYSEVTGAIYDFLSEEAKVYLDAYDDDSYEFDKFCIVTDPMFPREDVKGFFNELPDIDPIDRGRGFYECVPKGCSKGNAIKYILERFNISYDDAYVFGDSMNDFSMFTCGVKNRILMGEHDTGLEEHATFLTKSVDEDGIAYAIKMLGLI